MKHTIRRRITALLALGMLFVATPAWSQVNVVINGDVAHVGINILGITADFTLAFDQPQNLSVQSLGVSVELISPFNSRLRQRMPASRRGGLQVALPLKISIEPPAKHGLQFQNVVELELHTHLLPFQLDSPLRMYKSDNGGPYYDITTDIQPGSVRVRGRSGGFSDFIIVVDLTPGDVVADDKYEFLFARIADVPHYPTRFLLNGDLAASRSAYLLGDYSAATTALNTFESRVRKNAGSLIANTWRAQRDLDNVAGDLIAEASSLRFVLGRLGG